ncbi:MAG: EamA family transporter [Chitinophagaceae bacterium]|nr:EamA family transporter [Chitinophagaceae bacterium]
MQADTQGTSITKVIAAFAVIYIVWGSTYFFIQIAVHNMPVTVMGTFRFITAALLMLGWCIFNKEKIFVWRDIRAAFFTGLLLLFIGNGAVAWSEQYLASSLVAVFIASSPVWFVVLDYSKWRENFANRLTILGILLGFAGIFFLFGENLQQALSVTANKWELFSLGALTIGSISWAAGSLYGKYKPTSFSGALNSGWQMMGAGLAYAITGLLRDDWDKFNFRDVAPSGWGAILYLVTMGSLVGYSSYVWLLKVRPATQVSTHAYVNPVVAVLLGVFFANEKITAIQLTGLAIILGGVLLVNLAKNRKG